MLDEVRQSDERLFVNTSTGRFVRRDLPVLRRYHLIDIAGAVGGLLVLTERSFPPAVRLLNPFTGSLTRFAAPIKDYVRIAAAHVSGAGCSPPTLILFCDYPQNAMCWADPDSESFSLYEDVGYIPVAFVGGIYAAAREHGCSSLRPPEAVKSLTSLVSKQLAGHFSNTAEEAEPADKRCFLVESAGEILIVFKCPHHVEVFRVDTGSNQLERVKNLGSRALFVGIRRCLSVDADKFGAVDANSVYYVEYLRRTYNVRVYSLSEGTQLCAGGGAIDLSTCFFSDDDSPPSTPRDTQKCPSAPFSVVQLISTAMPVRPGLAAWVGVHNCPLFW